MNQSVQASYSGRVTLAWNSQAVRNVDDSHWMCYPHQKCPNVLNPARLEQTGLDMAEGGPRSVFTVEQRNALRARLLRLAAEDRRVVAGAAVGSLAVGGGDRFSDVDITFSITDHVPVAYVLTGWPPLHEMRPSVADVPDAQELIWVANRLTRLATEGTPSDGDGPEMGQSGAGQVPKHGSQSRGASSREST